MLLSAEDLVLDLPGDEGTQRVLDHVSLSLTSGEIVDVVGASGAGKTMLLRALARLLPKSQGRLMLEGTPAERVPGTEWRSRVALLPQKAAIGPGTVGDNLFLPWTLKVRHGRRPPSRADFGRALSSVGLDGIAFDRDAARLSVGQAARIALLRVVLTGPDVLLLDEPDANLDDASAEQVAIATRTFAERGGGVVRVRHQRADALAARRLILVAGKLEEAR
jgi:putative ABC transport system ATP-binding protein